MIYSYLLGTLFVYMYEYTVEYSCLQWVSEAGSRNNSLYSKQNDNLSILELLVFAWAVVFDFSIHILVEF